MSDEITISDADHQMIVLALAILSLQRPGWDDALREIAVKLDQVDLYECDKIANSGQTAMPDLILDVTPPQSLFGKDRLNTNPPVSAKRPGEPMEIGRLFVIVTRTAEGDEGIGAMMTSAGLMQAVSGNPAFVPLFRMWAATIANGSGESTGVHEFLRGKPL